MKQLFFRLNQQQFRNAKYKANDKQSSADTHREGSSELAPIEVESQSASPTEQPLSP
jgi:hypothetical protein